MSLCGLSQCQEEISCPMNTLQTYQDMNGLQSSTMDMQTVQMPSEELDKQNTADVSCVDTHQFDDVLFSRDWPILDKNVIEAPSLYLKSLPAKGVRDSIVDALNVWLQVPEKTTETVKRIVDILHESSLMLDDIQDSSLLRRGKPATHTVFGQSQTINSASYGIIRALQEAKSLGFASVSIVLEQLEVLYLGQSHDLHWTSNLECPMAVSYLRTIDSKTGGLFHLLLKLMETASASDNGPNLLYLVTLLGRHFGLRDDYQNISSETYSKQKGFCEDLDEGKYTLPILHALQNVESYERLILQNILSQRRANGKSSMEHKLLILKIIKQSGSLDYTLAVLRRLQAEIEKEIVMIETTTGTPNIALADLLRGLYV